MCTEPTRPKFFLSNMKILTPGFFCLITFFLLFFTNETRSIWKGWLLWTSLKVRSFGRRVMHCLGECKMYLTGKRHDLRTDQVMPSVMSLNISQDLSSYNSRATTLGEYQIGRHDNIVITHL